MGAIKTIKICVDDSCFTLYVDGLFHHIVVLHQIEFYYPLVI